MKFVIKSILVITFLLLSNAKSFAQTAENQENAEHLESKSMKVKGITCASDVKTIATNITKIEGVKECNPGKQGPVTTFEIIYNPALVTEKEIISAIEETGGCKNPDDRPYKVKL
jgi:copper chaperone CopZ